MTERSAQTNLQIYAAPDVVAHYAALDYLSPCERLLFESYIPPGCAVLDLGVGGGRTTSYLASRASHYVGVDYAESMVRACQAKFPGLEFVVADASKLSAFPDASFDAVVFAFNGVDYIHPEQARRSCFEHIHRVLKVGGVVIFSTHNARAFLVRPGWNRERLRRITRRFSCGSRPLSSILMGLLTLARSALALGQAVVATVPRVVKRVPSRVFWRGEGYMVDSVHGGLLTHYWIPGRAVDELHPMNLQPERIVGNDYPRSPYAYATDWYYYVFSKTCEK
jgi:SAM-dependent methyltransferase